MAKTVTVRLSDEDYRKIASAAKHDRRGLSNFMTLMVIKSIEEGAYVDAVEMDQILADAPLKRKLAAGHQDAQQRRGKLIG